MFDFSQNHFALFALPVSFDIDRAALASAYRALQQAVHPDRFATSGRHGQRLSLQAAMRVNEAHATLSDDLARARYLLELNGIGADPQATVNDAAFLAEQMAFREAMEEVASSSQPRGDIAELLARLDTQLDGQRAALSRLFARATPEALLEARDTVLRLQFLRRLRDEAAAIEADLDEAC